MALGFEVRAHALLSIGEAAAVAGVHRNTMRGWCASGRLPSVRVNVRGERRVRRGDLQEFLVGRARAAAADAAAAAAVLEGGRPSTHLTVFTSLPHTATPTARITPLPAGTTTGAASPLRAALGVVRTQHERIEALRRITADVAGALDLQRLFEDVLDASTKLFAAPASGLWLYGQDEHPFGTAPYRNLPPDFLDAVAPLGRGGRTAG